VKRGTQASGAFILLSLEGRDKSEGDTIKIKIITMPEVRLRRAEASGGGHLTRVGNASPLLSHIHYESGVFLEMVTRSKGIRIRAASQMGDAARNMKLVGWERLDKR